MSDLPTCAICHNVTLEKVDELSWKDCGIDFCCSGVRCHPQCLEEHFQRNGLQCLICRETYPKPKVYYSGSLPCQRLDVDVFNSQIPASRSLSTGRWDPDLFQSIEYNSYLVTGSFRLSCSHQTHTSLFPSPEVETSPCECFQVRTLDELHDRLFSFNLSGIQGSDCYLTKLDLDITEEQWSHILMEASIAFANHKRIYLLLPENTQAFGKLSPSELQCYTTLLNLSYQSIPLRSDERNSDWGKHSQRDFWFIPELRKRYKCLISYQAVINSILNPSVVHSPTLTPRLPRNSEGDRVSDVLPVADLSDPINLPSTPPVPPSSLPYDSETQHSSNDTNNLLVVRSPNNSQIGINTSNAPSQLVRRQLRHLSDRHYGIRGQREGENTPEEIVRDLCNRNLLNYRVVGGIRYLIDSSNTLYSTIDYSVAGVYNVLTQTIM